MKPYQSRKIYINYQAVSSSQTKTTEKPLASSVTMEFIQSNPKSL